MATIDILRWFIKLVDKASREYIPELPFDFWGMGILFCFVIVLVTGILTQNYIGTWVINRFDRFIKTFPLVGGLYGAIKKFLETIFSPTGNQFKQTVLVEFPQPGTWSIGFVTGTPDKYIQDKRPEHLVNVFIPLVPNPISGFYVLIPDEKIVKLDLPVQDAFRIVVSMGIVGSDDNDDDSKELSVLKDLEKVKWDEKK